MLIQGVVGPTSTQSVQPGATPAIRLGQLGDVVVSELHGRYYESNYRQSVFSAFINALTLTSTHASPLAGNTGTPILSLYNPAGTGKNLSLIKLQQSTTSGTPAGPLLWNLIPNPAAITATPTTGIGGAPSPAYNQSTLVQAGSVARMFNNTATTASTAGTAFRNAGGPTAVAVTGNIMSWTEEYAGSFIVPQNTMIALACTGAGTSHVISCYLEWEEIPA